MTEKIDDGGSAYPVPENNYVSDGTYSNPGMSLRDWFAGQCLVAMGTWAPVGPAEWPHRDIVQKMRAEFAYEQADAMIAARKVVTTTTPVAQVDDASWIVWSGSADGPALPPEAIVELQLRNGRTEVSRARRVWWKHSDPQDEHYGFDVIRYRVKGGAA